jgi:hypothetical protein
MDTVVQLKELLIYIFKFADTTTLMNCAIINRVWYQYASVALIRKIRYNINNNHNFTKFNYAYAGNIFCTEKYYIPLDDFVKTVSITTYGLNYINDLASTIKNVNIDDTYGTFDETNTFMNVESLKYLYDVSHGSHSLFFNHINFIRTDMSFLSNMFPNITKLSISGSINDHDLSKFTKLKFIKLDCCQNVDGKFITSQITHITVINSMHFDVTNLRKATELIKLKTNQYIDDTYIANTIESLIIIGYDSVISTFEHFPRLKKLKINGSVTNKTLKTIVSDIKYIDISSSNVSEISYDITVIVINNNIDLSNFQNLTKITISHGYHLNFKELNKLPKLQTLCDMNNIIDIKQIYNVPKIKTYCINFRVLIDNLSNIVSHTKINTIVINELKLDIPRILFNYIDEIIANLDFRKRMIIMDILNCKDPLFQKMKKIWHLDHLTDE